MRAFGGYLPLELPSGDDYFAALEDGKEVLRLNSAKTALWVLLRALEMERVALPKYLCPSVKDVLRQGVPDLLFYELDDELMPQLAPEEVEDRWVFVVNYFGLLDLSDLPYERCIVDQAHGFYAKPILRPHVYTLYSCKKFFGVPDGGYLVGDVDEAWVSDLLPEHVHDHFSYLVSSAEVGTEKDYAQKQAADCYLTRRHSKMSELTRGLLAGIDYEAVLKQRVKNTQFLQAALGKYNRLTPLIDRYLEERSASEALYLYPFLPLADLGDDFAYDLRQKLIQNKIYVPQLWQDTADEEFAGSLAYQLSAETSFLPVDQRYEEADMAEMTGRIMTIMEDLHDGEA